MPKVKRVPKGKKAKAASVPYSKKKPAAEPVAVVAKKEEKKKNPLFEKRPKIFGIGGDLHPGRDVTRYVRWPKYVKLQRQRRVLYARLKIPPAINQFSRTLDKNTAIELFKLMAKYKPESKKGKKVRLLRLAQAQLRLREKDQERIKRVRELKLAQKKKKTEERKEKKAKSAAAKKDGAKKAETAEKPKTDKKSLKKAPKKVVLKKKKVRVEKKKKLTPKKPRVLKYGINHITALVEQKKAKLVIIANDVDPVELVVWLPSLCRKMQVPYCIVKDKARLGAFVGKKTATAIAFTSIHKDDQIKFNTLSTAIKENYNDRFDEFRKQWGGGKLGVKSTHALAKKNKKIQRETRTEKPKAQ